MSRSFEVQSARPPKVGDQYRISSTGWRARSSQDDGEAGPVPIETRADGERDSSALGQSAAEGDAQPVGLVHHGAGPLLAIGIVNASMTRSGATTAVRPRSRLWARWGVLEGFNAAKHGPGRRGRSEERGTVELQAHDQARAGRSCFAKQCMASRAELDRRAVNGARVAPR